MIIHNGQTAAVINGLQDAIQSGKPWLGINHSIQQLSIRDIHFFETYDRAIDFKEFNQQQQKEIVLLPVDLTYEYLVDQIREAHGIGQTNPSIKIEVEFIRDLYEIIKVDLSFAHLVEEMDAFDWPKVFYDPLEANTEAESFEDKVQFNRLETLMEGLSAFAQINEHSQERIDALLHRYWDGEPMESQIANVLQGNLPKHNKIVNTVQESGHPISIDVLDLARIALANGKQWMAYNQSLYLIDKADVYFFASNEAAKTFASNNKSDRDAFQVIQFRSPEDILRQIPYGDQIIKSLNQTNMNEENLEYLQKQMLYSGFGEGLNAQLEKKLKEGLPDFQLQASHEFGRDKMEAVLYFSRSKQDGSDKYFFNKYDATLNNDHGKFQQTFFINNKGQSITFREACNLLNGRSVYKELTPKDGARYKAWVKLDFSDRDAFNNAKLNYFNEKYGFDLKEALSRIPLKELGDPEKMAALFTSLQRGDLAQATMVKPTKEMPVQISADPKFKTIRMFDKEGTKLYVPTAKQDVQYGKAPIDEKRAEKGVELEVGEPLGVGYKEKADKGLPGSENGESKARQQNRPEPTMSQSVKLNKKRTSKTKSRSIG
ncbi:MAG: hypothetical protein ACN4EP_07965 [Sediminibacterium sp.]